MLYCNDPVPPLAFMTMDPLFELKQVLLDELTAEITGARVLLTDAFTVVVQPLASETIIG